MKQVLLPLSLVADLLSVSKSTVMAKVRSGALVPTGGGSADAPLFRWRDLKDIPLVKSMSSDEWKRQETIKPRREYTSIELFAGAGGLALGLEQAGFKHILLNEFNHDACETLRTNRPDWNVAEGDVSKLDFTGYRGKVDVVSGGFPCQAFSYAGNRAGFDDARGTLFFEFARVIKETQPRMFIGENVRGLLEHNDGKTIEVIKSVIKDLGYTLVPPEVLKAIFYRVPQKRERLLLIGVRNDLAECFKFNWPTKAPRLYTVRDALKKGELFGCDVPESEGQKYPKRKAEILAMVPPGGYWRDLPIDIQREYMKGSFNLPGGKTGMARRLSWDEPCLTLTCAPAQNQTERCHPGESRPLTVREYARIQTFPDEWKFCGSMQSKYKQIGNAVPVNLAKAVGLRVIEALNNLEDHGADCVSGELGSLKSSVNQCGHRRCPPMMQMELFSPCVIRRAISLPDTLLGTCRTGNKDWILSNNMYNYPVTDKEAASNFCLFNVKKFILQFHGRPIGYYSVQSATICQKDFLRRFGYPVESSRHSESQRYIVYTLNPLREKPPKIDRGNSDVIVGVGVDEDLKRQHG